MNHEAMLAAFAKHRKRVDDSLGEVQGYLTRGQYVYAQMKLANIVVSMAKTSLSLRNMLIKDGYIEENKKK